MIKIKIGKMKTGTNNSAARPNTSIPPRTMNAHRITIDTMITLIGVRPEKSRQQILRSL